MNGHSGAPAASIGVVLAIARQVDRLGYYLQRAEIGAANRAVYAVAGCSIDESAGLWRSRINTLEERPQPVCTAPTDAVVRVTHTTICGTDLHILKGDVPTCVPGRILGHEGVGVVDSIGPAVTKPGDSVLVSRISACGKCVYCRRQMYSRCTTGGWILGNSIDGTQAEFVRIPHADTSLYPIPANADPEAMVMLSDILPTGFECGVLNGKVAPGGSVAIVGAGPIGLAALPTAQFYARGRIIAIDLDDNRLAVAKAFGATDCINSADGKAVAVVMALTGGVGVDTAIEAVGIPATFELCADIVAPGTAANVGVHGVPATLHLERLCSRNVTITTRLVDTASGLIGTDESCWGFPPTVGRATLGDAHWYQDRGHGLGQGSA